MLPVDTTSEGSLTRAVSQIKELRRALGTEDKRHQEETERISAEINQWLKTRALLLAAAPSWEPAVLQ